MNHEIDLRSLLDIYKRYKLLRPATVDSYADAIKNMESFCQSSVLLKSVTVDMLLNHRVWCLSRLRPTSYNKHRRHLRALINFAVVEGLTPVVQPFGKVGAAPVGMRRPKTVPTSWFKKASALLQAGSVVGLNPTKFWRLAFSVLHFTGMRRRQLVELKWGHVLFGRSALLLASEGSKSRREWHVPIPGWVVQGLREMRAEIACATGRIPLATDQVFFLPAFTARVKAGGLTVGHISRAFGALSKHLGYVVSAHRVRHTCATVMLERSGNIKAVSDILGHSDVNLTATTYVHPRLGALRRVQNSLPGYKVDEA